MTLWSTKRLGILDIVLQCLFLGEHVGIIVWNNVYPEAEILEVFGDTTMFVLSVGVASATVSLLMDGILLYFTIMEFEAAIFWWSFTCMGLAIPTWSAYLALTIYTRNIFLGVWALVWLCIRVSLVILVKIDNILNGVADICSSNTQVEDSLNGLEKQRPYSWPPVGNTSSLGFLNNCSDMNPSSNSRNLISMKTFKDVGKNNSTLSTLTRTNDRVHT